MTTAWCDRLFKETNMRRTKSQMVSCFRWSITTRGGMKHNVHYWAVGAKSLLVTHPFVLLEIPEKCDRENQLQLHGSNVATGKSFATLSLCR